MSSGIAIRHTRPAGCAANSPASRCGAQRVGRRMADAAGAPDRSVYWKCLPCQPNGCGSVQALQPIPRRCARAIPSGSVIAGVFVYRRAAAAPRSARASVSSIAILGDRIGLPTGTIGRAANLIVSARSEPGGGCHRRRRRDAWRMVMLEALFNRSRVPDELHRSTMLRRLGTGLGVIGCRHHRPLARRSGGRTRPVSKYETFMARPRAAHLRLCCRSCSGWEKISLHRHPAEYARRMFFILRYRP
jgi:hypothetical protein